MGSGRKICIVPCGTNGKRSKRLKKVSFSFLFVLQSTVSETDAFVTGNKRDVYLIDSQIKGVKKGRDQLCPSYRESNKGSKERQGPTLGVRLIEVSML